MISKSQELVQARAKAKKIVADARAKAKRILADARAKAKEIKAKRAKAKAKSKAKNKREGFKAKRPHAEQSVSRSQVLKPSKPLTSDQLHTLAERLYAKAVSLGSNETKPITILSLRQAFPRIGKDNFDAALLKLANATDFILRPRHPIGRDAFQTPSDEGGIERHHQWQRLIYAIREPLE